MAGTKSVRDLLADDRVPGLLRDSVPVLTEGSSILWVAGHRIAHAARVTPSTRRVAHIRLRMSRPRNGSRGST
jgi:tRNA(Ile)-lysidine synthase